MKFFLVPFYAVALLTSLVDAKASKKGARLRNANNGAALNPSDTTVNLLSSKSGSGACDGEPKGSAILSGDGIPFSERTEGGGTIPQAYTAEGEFKFQFSSDLAEMVYTLEVQDINFRRASFVNQAWLLCTAAAGPGTIVATLEVQPFGGKSSGDITKGSSARGTTATLSGVTCGTGVNAVTITTVAGLYDAMAKGYITVAVEVDDFVTRLSTAEIWGRAKITDFGSSTDILSSPGSGCVIATGDSVILGEGDPRAIGFFDFKFNNDLSVMTYTTGSAEPNLNFLGTYFRQAALYCGNAGTDRSPATPLASIFVSANGSVYEGRITSTVSDSFGLTTDAECPTGVSIETLAQLKAAMAQGLVHYEVETILDSYIRGQVVLNKN